MNKNISNEQLKALLEERIEKGEISLVLEYEGGGTPVVNEHDLDDESNSVYIRINEPEKAEPVIKYCEACKKLITGHLVKDRVGKVYHKKCHLLKGTESTTTSWDGK